MSNLNETINQVQGIFSDIKSALNEQGVDTKNMKPTEYANAVRNVVNESIKEIGIFPAMIFTYSKVSEIPKTPLGGKWVVDPENKNGMLVPPTGWYTDLSEVEDISTTSDQIWMTTATFKDNGDIYTNWITPFRISGKDGKDGKKGDQGVPGPVAGVIQYYYIPYYLEDKFGVPNTPTARYNNGILENITDGWTTTIDKSDDTVWWMSTASYNNNMANGDLVSFTAPVRISTTESDKKQGTIRYYHLSNSPSLPSYTDSWLQWVDGVVPTLSKPYLYCYEATSYTQSEISKSPIYLLTTYSNGLKSIDFDYTCGPSQDSISSEEQIWFDNTEDAITPNSETGYLGLNEDTKLLWCREKFIYVDESQNKVFYRILSSYTAAEKAAIIYSAGVFNPNVVYLRTNEQRPYVYYPEGLKLNDEGNIDSNGKEYYYFVLKYSYDDEFHKIQINNNYNFESAYANGNWEKMESFEAIYSDIGVFKAANVGKFVFDDKYIFSQLGKNKQGNVIRYEEFVDYPNGFNVIAPEDLPADSRRTGIAYAIETGDFVPNILLNAQTGEAKFGAGSSVLKPDGSASMANGNLTWDENGLSISGSINVTGGQLSKTLSDLSNNISEAQEEWITSLNNYQTTTGETIVQLNKRLDGAVSNYYKEGVPTTNVEELKILFEESDNWDAHIGDTWTNVNTYQEESSDPNYSTGGSSWRWCEGDGDGHSEYSVTIGSEHYHWHLISDNDAARALLKAGEALTVANSKTTTHISTSPTNISEGDIWIVPEEYSGTTYEKNKTYVYKAGKWNKYTDPDAFTSDKKEDLAKQLGYNSYDDFCNSDSIIDNGKIRTGLIEANAIVTDKLISDKIAAATIAANSVKTTNASTVGSCELDGSTFKITGQSGKTFIDIGEHSSTYFEQNKDNSIENSIEETPDVSDFGTSITWAIKDGSKLTNASTIKIEIFKSGDTKCQLTIRELIFRVKYQITSENNKWVAPVWQFTFSPTTTINWNLFTADNNYKPYLLIGSSIIRYPDNITESEIPTSPAGTEESTAGKLLEFNSVIDVPSNTSVYLVIPAQGINIVKFYNINNRSGEYTVNCSYTYSSVNNALISGSKGTMISSGKAFILAEDGKIETCGVSNMGLVVKYGDIYGKDLSSRHILVTNVGDTTIYLPELSESEPGDFFELWIGSNPTAKISTGDQYYLYADGWNTLNGTNNLSAGIYKCMRTDSSWWIVKY